MLYGMSILICFRVINECPLINLLRRKGNSLLIAKLQYCLLQICSEHGANKKLGK